MVSEHQTTFYSILRASSWGTALATLVGNPFEVLKTRQMMTGGHSSLAKMLKSLVQAEGLRVAWRGVPLALTVGISGNACYFLMYEGIKQRMTEYIGVLGYGVSALLSRGATVALMTPIEILKTKAYAGTGPAAAQLLLYHGLQAQITRDVIWSAVCWQAYETLYPFLREKGIQNDVGNVAGAVSGAVLASVLTHPFDLLKTRLQLNYNLSENPLVGVQELWALEGIEAFTLGLAARCLKTSVSICVFILIYTRLRTVQR